MKKKFQNSLRAIYLLVVVGVVGTFLPQQLSAQIGIHIPAPPRTVSLFEPHVYGLERIAIDSTVFKKRPSVYRRTVKLDSTGKFVSIREAVDNTDLLLPAVVDLDTYVRLRTDFEIHELWKRSLLNAFKGQTQKSSGAIHLDIPLGLKSKTFTRIFGSDRIGLRVTGNISFDLSGRTENRSGSAVTALENQNTFSPRFHQTQQFTVEGKIGDKVTVSVEQNSEATVDIENTLKLRYDGDEDEIVQKIEAGNISLSLPSTKYVIFGGSNKGLFGLKSQLQVGNLYMTAIASLEKGQQQELSLSGSAQESKTTVKDYDFIKYRYFFADRYYHDHFEDGLKDDPTTFSYQAGTEILKLEVWESVNQSDNQARRGIAVVDPTQYLDANLDYKDVDIDTVTAREGKVETGYFKPLEEGKDYSFDKYRGFFVLNQPVDNNTVLAIAYANAEAVSNPALPSIGTLQESLADTSQPVVLKLIKPRAMQPNEVYKDTWSLMMRNVYSLGGTNIQKDGFDVRLENNVNGDHATYPEGSDKSYMNLLGLDLLDQNGEPVDGGDEKIDNNPYIVDYANGILIYPVLQPFDPEKGSRFQGKLPEKDLVDIYNLSTTNNQAYLERHKFDMIITSKSTKSTFDLGFYVLEGSEVVTLGGRTLERDKDYTIDYFSGQLTLLSNEAKRSSSDIQVKYERANLFQLDKKTIFGGRMEYRFLDNSFVGLTALYLNKTTLDQRVRVGQEPFRNFVWDLNAAFKFKPRIITKMINALPIVETNAESHINIEGEFAQVFPNANTLNNTQTGDQNGVAYVDDFESSKRATTLGIRYRTWSMASTPEKIPALGIQDVDQIEADRARGHITWFNPYHQTLIKEIWPNRDVNSQTGQTTDVLGIDLWRDKDSDPDSAWAGIMRSTISFADQQKTKYIEMWIKGGKVTVNIDIGRISEDWYIRGKTVRGERSLGGLNTEDRNNNGLLELDEDVGLDGIPDGQPGDDPYDDWQEPRKGVLNIDDGYSYDGINGTEGNHNSREARYPDTEDLDGDGQLSLINAYYEYTFSLDSNSAEAKKWNVSSTKYGWKQYRIPLKDFSRIIGNPDPQFQQIFFVRLWFSDLPEERTRIKIATFDFVGNEWEENGVADKEGAPFVKNDSVFTLATYNTEENADAVPGGPEPYRSPPGVTGVRDRITRALSKEQSLVLRIHDLKAGQVAEARKTLFNAMDLINYKRLRMFVHGDQYLPEHPPDVSAQGDTLEEPSWIRLYLRFGSDANNYYEYGQDVYQGWNKVNEFDIDLDALAKVKSVDSLNIGTADSAVYYKRLPGKPDGYFKARGRPNMKNVRYFILGVKHRGDEIGRNPDDFTGEIWLDELRLSDVRTERATALRLNTDIKLADVASFNAQWESKDADFHNISTQFGKGNTDERQNYQGKIILDKFLPDSWDISIPVDGRMSFSRSIPKYRPKTDELTGYRNNTIGRKLSSLFGLRRLDPALEDEISKNETYGFGTTIKRRGKSKRWYLRYTLDGMSFDFDWAKKKSSNWEMLYNNSEQYKESFSYNVPFGKARYISPFRFIKKIPLLKKIATQRLYYLPSKLGFSMNISDSKTAQLRRGSTDIKRNITTGSTRSLRAGYKMFNSLNFTYSRTHRADADFVGLSHRELLKSILTRGYFGLDTDINQSFKADYRPKLLDWLSTDFSFNNTFTYQLTNANKYKQAATKVSKRLGLTFNPGKLVKSIYKPKNKSRSSRSRGRNRGRRGSTHRTNQGKKENPQQKKTTKKKFRIPNPLMGIYNFFASWQSIKTTISQDERVSNKYLSGLPDWQYQFGISLDPGVPQDSSLLAQNINLIGPASQKSTSIRTTTNYTISKYIRASFSHSYTMQETNADYGKTRSGNKSTSYLAIGDDPIKDFKGLAQWRAFVPDWTLQISGLEKFLFFPLFAKNVTLDHGHASKYTENLILQTDGTLKPSTQTFTNNWQPLVGLSIRTKWGVSGTIRWTNSTNFNYSQAGGATKTLTSAFTVTTSFKKTSGFKIPIPIWPFNGRTFKNEINFNMTFDASSNQTFQKQFDQKKFVEKQRNKTWKLRPSATYRFSSRVQGSLFYERGSTDNKISGKYSYNEFGITVNIAIRD